MNHLLRDLAPITPTAWAMLDDEARTRLVPVLTGRTLVDFAGPYGWEYAATPLGRVEPVVGGPVPGAEGRRRVALPLAELRVPFTVSRTELDAADRGAVDVDLSDLDRAAATLAAAENTAVFTGWPAAGFVGVGEHAQPSGAPDPDASSSLPYRVAAAVSRLQSAGVAGPYGLALDDDSWVTVAAGTDEGGATLTRHLDRILGGPTVRVPGLDRPVVLSLRGGDFLFESGQDVSVGYSAHTEDTVTLYLEETFSFRVATPEAAALLPAPGDRTYP